MPPFSYYPSVLGSLVLHGLVLVLMLGNWHQPQAPELRTQPKVVQAKLVELEAKAPPKRTEVVDLAARRREEAEAERRRQAELERQRKERERQKQLEEQRQREAAERRERERQAEQERQRELERQRQEQQTQERIEEFEQALAEEESFQAAMVEQEIVDAVGYEIEQAVERNWNRPPSARRGMQAVLRVALVPTGGLSSVDVLESSGDAAFDRSAMQAVQKAAPFEMVQQVEPMIFERNFRTFQFRFSPQDLRL